MENRELHSDVQSSSAAQATQTISAADSPFVAGATVVYSLHGFCTVLSVENRCVGDEQVALYRLERKKSNLSRSSRPSPSIFVPVASARTQGVRLPMNLIEAQAAIQILSTRDFYFPLAASWQTILPELEQLARVEGGPGLAKVFSYVSVRSHREIVETHEITRYLQTISRQLYLELSAALQEMPAALEARIARLIRLKVHSNQ